MTIGPTPSLNLHVYYTNKGNSLADLSRKKPVLLVFLRPFGCTFCREALSDIAEKKSQIEALGTQIVLIHLDKQSSADKYLAEKGLSGLESISDPDCRLYQKFGLVKATMNQLFGFSVWMRAVESGIKNKNGWGKFVGDGFQMPGVFVIQNGKVEESFIHEHVSDRPNYEDLVKCCVPMPPNNGLGNI